ncbi:MAG: type II CAAX prenyl endopeptidase Rce1 family protein [Candidatus Brocadiia bacterium]
MVKQLKEAVVQRESLALLYVVAVLCIVGYHRALGLLPPELRGIERRLTQGVLFLVPTALFALVVLGENPLRLGLRPGDVRAGAAMAAVFAVFMAGAVLAAARLDSSLAAHYPVYKGAAAGHGLFVAYAAANVFYMFGWEYLFRGFLLFALAKRFGSVAIVVQTVPFALAHVGKPQLEAFASILAGLALGALALRARSMWPCFAVHAFTAVWMDACVVYVWA